jgi:hypothetical protein
VPGLPSGPVTGEIVHPDGGVVTVPVIDLSAHPADYVTMTGLLDAISEGPQSHAYRRVAGGWDMVVYMALILAGLVLMAIGWVFNAQTVAMLSRLFGIE